MTQAQAARLNTVDKASLDLLEQPIEPDPPVEKAKVKAEPAPKSVPEWKSPEWSALLKGKVIASEDKRYLILDVSYDKSKRQYSVKSVDFDLTENGKPTKGAARSHTDLAFVLFECRNEAWFTVEMQDYYRARLSDEDMKIPAAVSGGRLRVLRKFLRA